MSLFREQIPEYDRELVGFIVETEAFGPGDKCLLGLARLGDAGEIALDVGGEDRDAGAGEALRQHLQCDRLAGAGRSGDQSMAVGKRKRRNFGLEALPDEDRAVFVEVCHGTVLPDTSSLLSLSGVCGQPARPRRNKLDLATTERARSRSLSHCIG